jgi:hypothetical protein
MEPSMLGLDCPRISVWIGNHWANSLRSADVSAVVTDTDRIVSRPD